MPTALINGRVLIEGELITEQAVLIEGGRIVCIAAPEDPRCRSAAQYDLRGRLLLPGFIDTQVNGGGGVLFNDAPSVETIRTIAAAHRRFGTTGFLPTLISDEPDVIARGIAAVAKAIDAGVPGVLGIHIEGPFINPQRRGVHDARRLRELDEPAFQLLTSLKRGKTVVTLAPEMTTPATIRRLSDAGVLVAAGHTNATYEQMREALDDGITAFTHLFNAMSPLTARDPGAVGAALEDPRSWCGLIFDTHHVAPATVRLALRCKPLDRFMLVTDAMPPFGTSATTFTLHGRPISLHDAQLRDPTGRLAGANTDLPQCLRNAMHHLSLTLPQAVQLVTRNPAAFLTLDNEHGRIAPGYRANFVATDDDLTVQETWIDGHTHLP